MKRFHLLDMLIKEKDFKTGAEIGIARGKTTRHILENNPTLKLIAVDVFRNLDGKQAGQMGKGWKPGVVRQEFIKNIFPFLDRVILLEEKSETAVNKIPDNSLDFVFIDADHRYEAVKQDIENWIKKVKIHGMLIGHDFHFEGVEKAVKELLPSYRLTGHDNCWLYEKQ